jgi:hypothetical protein
MGWFSSVVHIAATQFPVTSALSRWQDEIDRRKTEERLIRLEDPISQLHEDAQKVSRAIFDKMVELDSQYLEFDEEFYATNNRVLTIFDAERLLKGHGDMTRLYYTFIVLTNPLYILYLCDLFADKDSMEKLYKAVDSCHLNESLLSKDLQEELTLPFPVIEAVFEIFEAKGLGFLSKFPGNLTRYIGKA